MQLGGTPPQLFDQARDGVADIVWTIPTYQAGRFTKSEVFELPFMTMSAETGSPALWDYIQKNSLDEFKGVKLLAAHIHDGSLLHFASKRVTNMDEIKGLKIRAPTRIGTKFLAAIGADSEEKQELDPALMAAATIVTDLTEQCAAFGDLRHAIASGKGRAPGTSRDGIA